MTNIDTLLLKLLTCDAQELELISERDIKVLKSLAKIINTPNFITENQSRLLIKILNENLDNFKLSKVEMTTALALPTWSKEFRPVDRTKKLFIDQVETQIVVEFAFSSSIRKLLNGMSKRITGFFQQHAGKYYRADLTEANIILLVDELTPLGFDIDQKVLDFYHIIKSWSEEEYRRHYFLTNITHTNFQKQITTDLGLETAIDENIINDRSIRYQYILEKPRKIPENLTDHIANRTGSKVWVNNKEVRLEQVISSLLKLQRLPTLIIFDSNDHKKCHEELELLNQSLEENGIFDQVGIYFRLPNNEHGSNFNKLIADRGYNYQLDSTTKIVGVQNGKIPKFFLKTDWKPMSVITIGNTLKQTKTAVYANYCDLIISYTESEPIIENRILWE